MKKKTQAKKVKIEDQSIHSIYEIIRKPAGEKVHYDTLKEYDAFLNSLNLVDLQNHAVTLGLKPGRDRSLLINTLIRQFARTKALQFGRSDQTIDENKANKILNLLARSR